jgi:threonine dehydratase
MLREHLADFLLVDDDSLRDALVSMFTEERIVMEGACAASLAGARAMADEIAGSTVVLQVSGRNVDSGMFLDLVGDA